MKQIKLLVFFSLIAKVSLTQTAYYDAISIKNSIEFQITDAGRVSLEPDSTTLTIFSSIFKNYFTKDSLIKVSSDADLLTRTTAEFESNPFLVIGTDLEQDADVTGVNGSNPKTFSLSSLSSFNVTSFADGLAKFLVERTKEELNVAFFSKLQKLSEKYPEFEILFPHTQALLNSFEAWNYANILNTLREAFNKDLKELLINISRLPELNISKCKSDDKVCIARVDSIKSFLAKPEGRIFLSAVLLGNGFLSGEKLPDVINKIAGDDYMGSGFSSDITNSVKLINNISLSLRNKESGKNYISAEDFKSLMSDDALRNIYLGLLYQKIKNENIFPALMASILNSFEKKAEFVAGVKNYVESILSQASDLTAAINNLNEAKKKGELDFDSEFAGMFESGGSVLQTIFNIQQINIQLPQPAVLQNVLEYSKRTLEIAHDIAVKNYSAAVVATLTFMSEKLPPSTESQELIKEFVKYGSFAANVVQAKNSDEVKEAIKVIALPSGSSSIKRESSFNVALNAYVGPYYGYEKIKGVDSGKWNSYGVTAPVGISISRGHSILFFIPTKCGFSSSVFFSLIDVGALTSFRFTNDSAEKVPDIQLKDIVSPGVFYSLGIPKTPLSFNVGYQIGPLLREVHLDENKFSDRYSRFSISLCVDIPVLNFFTSTRLKKDK